MITKKSIQDEILNEMNVIVKDILANSKDRNITMGLLRQYFDLTVLSCELNETLSK